VSDPVQRLFDVFIIGGGINGVGIANDAAGRGLDVMLCEMNDLASATSSASSKLIHGGLRYLEHYEFRLVKEALAEREVLLKNAPHIISPLRFILPHQPHLRPAWMIRSGLFLYDNLSKRVTLEGSKSIKFGADSELVPEIKKGFEYSDAKVSDTRLTLLNAVSARNKGATIKTRTKCINATTQGGVWQITLIDQLSGEEYQVQAKTLVNAAGPWVDKLINVVDTDKISESLRLVQGSHIVVPKITDQSHAYILQNSDGRIVFILPYENDFNLIGTTDLDYVGEPSEAKITDGEIDYLIEITNQYLNSKISRSDIVHTYCGVRPLLQDEAENAQKATRDYTLELHQSKTNAPLLTIYGGKITTYRKLSEAAVNKLATLFTDKPSLEPWTRHAPLPGGDFEDKEVFATTIRNEFPWLPDDLRVRLITSYGSLIYGLLGNCKALSDLGRDFGANLFEREVRYMVEQEWATCAEDILWRRSKVGLRISEAQKAELEQFVKQLMSIEGSQPPRVAAR